MSGPPSSDDRRSRSDAASRLAALLAEAGSGAGPGEGADGEEGPGTHPDSGPTAEPRPSGRQLIRRRSPEAGAEDADRGDDLATLRLPPLAATGSDDSGEVDLSALDTILRDLPGGRLGEAADAPVVAPLAPLDGPPAPPDDALPALRLPDGPAGRPEDDDTLPTVGPVAPLDAPAADPDATMPLAILDLLEARLAGTEAPAAGDEVVEGEKAPDDRADGEQETDRPGPEAEPENGADEGAPGAERPLTDQSGDGDVDPRPPVGLPVVVVPADADGPDRADDSPDDEADDPRPPVKVSRITPRAVAFGLVLVALIAAVPLLGLRGQDRILASRGGNLIQGSSDPAEPGYRILVVPTQTALVLHRDSEGVPLFATVLALGAGTTGGTVLQVPLETRVRNQRFYIDRLSAVYPSSEDIDLLVREIEDRLGVALDEEVLVDDESLAELVAPIAPVTIENPDPVATPEGESFPAGTLSLAADQIGPFLRASSDGESELGHLARNEIVWTAWLEAIGRAGGQDSVGVATTGIGPFLRILAEGTTVEEATTLVETLDVTPPATSDQENPPLEPAPGMEGQIIDAVPYPLSPRLGRRFSLKLLNGVNGEEVPMVLMRDLMLAGASLSTLGNADEFGQTTTTIEISGDVWQEGAEAVRFVLDPGAEISLMTPTRAESEGVDMVVTLGSDVVDTFEERAGG